MSNSIAAQASSSYTFTFTTFTFGVYNVSSLRSPHFQLIRFLHRCLKLLNLSGASVNVVATVG